MHELLWRGAEYRSECNSGRQGEDTVMLHSSPWCRHQDILAGLAYRGPLLTEGCVACMCTKALDMWICAVDSFFSLCQFCWARDWMIHEDCLEWQIQECNCRRESGLSTCQHNSFIRMSYFASLPNSGLVIVIIFMSLGVTTKLNKLCQLSSPSWFLERKLVSWAQILKHLHL